MLEEGGTYGKKDHGTAESKVSDESRFTFTESKAGASIIKSANNYNCDASFCSEVVGWGYDGGGGMGLGMRGGGRGGADRQQDSQLQELVHEPRSIPLEPSITVQRVHSIACSANHTLLLTHFGSLYTCGENTEGALGMGDMISRYVRCLATVCSSVVV